MMGLGAGWNEEESRALGFPFPSTSERFELLEETLQFLLQMWSVDEKPFSSRHIDAARTLNSPAALSRPHPPIMVGGAGERKTLRLVARYAQACNLFDGPDLEHKLDVLRQHCADEGRDYGEITKTVFHPYDIGEDGKKTEELLDDLGRLHGLGIDVVLGALPDQPNLAALERFGSEIIPRARQL
jgi:alkanesulfonate monooxygenase SsuD/methylene tetrahydromethanopterin reductase-like flavin-dependent oxidoreductase (luciferase family)